MAPVLCAGAAAGRATGTALSFFVFFVVTLCCPLAAACGTRNAFYKGVNH